jgi:hypothetical protein
MSKATGKPASRLIEQRIRDLGGWRGETLARMRALILEADPEMTEEWMGTPVWSHHGIVCTGEAYTNVVKLTCSSNPFRSFVASHYPLGRSDHRERPCEAGQIHA